MYQRKTVRRPDKEEQDRQRALALEYLLAVTEEGSKALGCTGASFVLIGLGIWIEELSELDRRATAQMLRAIADIHDPGSNDIKKAKAEKKRRHAVERIFAALDLVMAEPTGRA